MFYLKCIEAVERERFNFGVNSSGGLYADSLQSKYGVKLTNLMNLHVASAMILRLRTREEKIVGK